MNTIENPYWTAADFIAEDLLLDFLNTTGGKSKARENERLASSPALFDWGLASQLIDNDEYQRLLQHSQADSATADNELSQVIQWREAVHALLHALASGEEPHAVAAKRVQTVIKQALASAQLHHAPGQPSDWRIDSHQAAFLTIKYRLALHLNQAMTGGKYQQVKECEACSWMFIDTSRSRKRRWCSMSTCGNRAKARRFYQNENNT
ncbi:CGNR zinc finger domain-containing protein [Pseudomonas sp. NPDC078700]|uniref:CGNR zinc finger domain-containing protein n=1 Tax=Pseudomonas sp. NPDC078700 TaxID=3364424 RepID=UPI0037CBE8B5